MQLRQFVVSRAHATFPEIAESIRTFQELLEVDTVTHVFKSVSNVYYVMRVIGH